MLSIRRLSIWSAVSLACAAWPRTSCRGRLAAGGWAVDDALGQGCFAGKGSCRISSAADGSAGLDESQRPVGICRAAESRRGAREIRRPNPGAVSDRIGAVGRDEARRAGEPRLVSPHDCSLEGLGDGKRVLLHFGAVDWEATVWLNGKELGQHRGGYDGFTFDITDALTPDATQQLVVAVWNPIDTGTQPRGKQVSHPGGIMYTPSTGIWQTVWLEPVPASQDRIADDRARYRRQAGSCHRFDGRRRQEAEAVQTVELTVSDGTHQVAQRRPAARASRSICRSPSRSCGRPTIRFSMG